MSETAKGRMGGAAKRGAKRWRSRSHGVASIPSFALDLASLIWATIIHHGTWPHAAPRLGSFSTFPTVRPDDYSALLGL
jgi:hypothetical protein